MIMRPKPQLDAIELGNRIILRVHGNHAAETADFDFSDIRVRCRATKAGGAERSNFAFDPFSDGKAPAVHLYKAESALEFRATSSKMAVDAASFTGGRPRQFNHRK